MKRLQIHFPDPLYRRLKAIAAQQDRSLSEVIRKAAEHFVTRFPEEQKPKTAWRFPTLDCGGDFLIDPVPRRPEADAIMERKRPPEHRLTGRREIS